MPRYTRQSPRRFHPYPPRTHNRAVLDVLETVCTALSDIRTRLSQLEVDMRRQTRLVEDLRKS
jgi:hypothetical protein